MNIITSLTFFFVIKWNHFPCYWSFVRGIHRSTVNSPHNGQWRGAYMFSLICASINGWVNNREAVKRHRAHYDVIVMCVSRMHGHFPPSCMISSDQPFRLVEWFLTSRNTIFVPYNADHWMERLPTLELSFPFGQKCLEHNCALENGAIAYSTTNHYLNQCWLIIYKTPSNGMQ